MLILQISAVQLAYKVGYTQFDTQKAPIFFRLDEIIAMSIHDNGKILQQIGSVQIRVQLTRPSRNSSFTLLKPTTVDFRKINNVLFHSPST